MSRAERLLDLIQILRRHRRPVSGRALADTAGVSLRTLYRDIRSLQAQGAAIDGEPGIGYILRPGFMLPPLMFQEEEIEALVLGSRWVANRADQRLGAAARNALAKIAAVLPDDLREALDASPLLIGPGKPAAVGDAELVTIRQAIRRERTLQITYEGSPGSSSEGRTQRLVWPFALAYFESTRMVVAWCELRRDFRNFRTDRIMAMAVTETRYPRRRQALLKEWREAEGIAPQ